jgi:hypothetical protein
MKTWVGPEVCAKAAVLTPMAKAATEMIRYHNFSFSHDDRARPDQKPSDMPPMI